VPDRGAIGALDSDEHGSYCVRDLEKPFPPPTEAELFLDIPFLWNPLRIGGFRSSHLDLHSRLHKKRALTIFSLASILDRIGVEALMSGDDVNNLMLLATTLLAQVIGRTKREVTAAEVERATHLAICNLERLRELRKTFASLPDNEQDLKASVDTIRAILGEKG
jgi:hypothetical protein